MSIYILKKLNQNFKNFNIKKIESGASKKNLYKLWNQFNSYIVIDFKEDKEEYNSHIRIYDILKEIEISIPQIIEKNDDDLIIVSEDFGELRFDKILNDYQLRDLLHYAVETLIIIRNSIKFNNLFEMSQYNFKIFKSEIMELPTFYFPYVNLNNKDLIEEFVMLWSEAFSGIKFEFDSFTHKDFNINNLILLPSNKNNLKCGVIDFQSAFWGESSWDLFSLLEDSRILFSDEYNEYFIKLFYSNTNHQISFTDFVNKYYFLNASRQTRLLGRWIKLSNKLNQKRYLDFIPSTLHRLHKSINLTKNKNLINFYKKYILI